MKKIWLFAILILAAVFGVVLTTKPSPNSAAHSSTGVPPVMEPPRQAGRLPYTSTPAPAQSASSEAAQIAPFLSAPITLQDGGPKRPFELATDELYLRQADGDNRVVKVPKTDTPEAFAAAIQKARTEHGSEPELVLYPAGLPRNEYTRRIVTREVVVNAPTRAEADVLAAAQGLVFQKSPVFAPNSFVYEAPTSAKSLSVQADKTASIEATPLLASRSAKKSMPNDPFVQLQWHLKYQNQQGAVAGTDINVESVWNYPSVSAGNYTRGGNVTIGIVDDGLEWSHPDLTRNMRNELNWDWNGRDNDPKPLPFHSHGTACAGVAAARGNNRIGVSGVAPEASLVGLRLIADNWTDLDEAEAMAWEKDQIEIKSNSWGPVDDGQTLEAPDSLMAAALKYATDFGRDGKGSIITFAGGNGRANDDNSNYDGYANSLYTIAVAAMDSDGLQSWYSESGANLIVSAPSNGGPLGIMATDNKGWYGYNEGLSGFDIYGRPDFPSSGDVTKNFGGTSSACPAVSGVIALMLDKNPDLGWRDVQEILIESAKKVDLADTDWIDNGAGYHFNHKYGAGLVDAAAAVDLASTWNNLGPQKSKTVSTAVPLTIAPGATENRTFTVNGDDLRLEHVTLRLTIEDIKKGDLEITLTSPDGTTSVFCEPHSDIFNNFTNWTFMTVRNWGESSNGSWILSITNHGATAGNMTEAELVVYGTDSDALVDAPVVTLAASRTEVFVGANLTLTAMAKDRNNDRIENVEAFDGVNSLGVSANGTWTIQANKAGNYTFTVNATDGSGTVGTSNAVEVQVIAAPIAAWDFDTPQQSPFPLATVVQGAKKYAANFGSGNMSFNGDFTDLNQNPVIRNLWSHQTGEIWISEGDDANAVGDMRNNRLTNEGLKNTALLIRGGKNIGAQGKSIVFQFSMENQDQLVVSYASKADADGFNSHTWSWSSDGVNWSANHTLVPNSSYDSQSLPVTSDLADQATAYLRVEFTGATAASGQNLIDNVILSASQITVDPVSENFTVLARASTKAEAGGVDSLPAQSQKSPDQQPQLESGVPQDSQNLDWVLGPLSIHEMVVHAEVVDGGQFLNASGSLLSATEDGKVLGLAEPVPQTTRYDLGITSSDPAPEPLRLKVYDSQSKGILVLEEKVPFAPGATIGSPSTPKRYKVAYQEAEQVVLVAPGWNTFTTAVDPDPATLEGVLVDYDATEGDRLVGPEANATVIQGKWNPTGLELKPQTTYTLLRQAPSGSQILLKGKALPQGTPKPPHDRYGIWMDLPNGSISTMDWLDADGDEIDDRFQPGPSMPMQGRASMPLAPVSGAQPAPAASSAGASNSATKASNSTKGSKRTKSSSFSKKKNGKKSKSKSKSS